MHGRNHSMPVFDTPEPISVTVELGVGDLRVVAGDRADTVVEVPAGSHLRGEAGVAALRCQGRLGECHFKTGLGDIQLDQADAVQLRTGMGDVAVERAGGDAEVSTGSGSLRVGRIDGAAVVKSSNGDIWIGEVAGNLRANTA